MCKGCQYCLESCYWHLIEKRFCYDETIALYDEPVKTVPIRNTSFENMAFYDQVSLIAGRSIVTIDPLPRQPKPIEHQPVRRVRWWEDTVDSLNKENESKNVKEPIKFKPTSIPTIKEESKENLTESTEELDNIVEKIKDADETDHHKEVVLVETKKEGNKSTIPKSASSLTIEEPIKTRKKSLRERRMSRSLTLHIDRNIELPVIRQLSMPKFYIDTPESNQTDSSILVAPSATLMSPVLPRNNEFEMFDLRSVVQMENEHRSHHHHHHHHSVQQPHVPVHKQPSPHSRLSHIKEKLKPIKIKRQGSASNLPNSIQHI